MPYYIYRYTTPYIQVYHTIYTDILRYIIQAYYAMCTCQKVRNRSPVLVTVLHVFHLPSPFRNPKQPSPPSLWGTNPTHHTTKGNRQHRKKGQKRVKEQNVHCLERSIVAITKKWSRPTISIFHTHAQKRLSGLYCTVTRNSLSLSLSLQSLHCSRPLNRSPPKHKTCLSACVSLRLSEYIFLTAEAQAKP